MSEKESIYKTAAAKGFSRKEVDGLLNIQKKFCSAVMKEYFTGLIDDKAEREQIRKYSRLADVPQDKKAQYSLYRKLKAKMLKVNTEKDSGYVEISFDYDGKRHILRISTIVVDRGHTIDVKIPHEETGKLQKDVLNQVSAMATNIRTYYDMFVGEFFGELAEFFPDINVKSPTVQENTGTLYVDDAYDKRVGVFAYYVDESGKPYSLG